MTRLKNGVFSPPSLRFDFAFKSDIILILGGCIFEGESDDEFLCITAVFVVQKHCFYDDRCFEVS